MRIDRASVHSLRVPLDAAYSGAHHPDLDTLNSVLVTVTDDAGRRGIGTADTVRGYSELTHEAVHREAADVLRSVAVEERLNYTRFLRHCARTSPEANARCAVETAVLDLYTRRKGLTLGEFFGGLVADTQPLNAWIGFDDPGAMAAEASEWRKRGFDSLKIKLTGDRDRDIERVDAVCEAVGDGMEVRADANCAYETVDDAVAVARAVEGSGLSHFEQPIAKDDICGLKRLTDATAVPIVADECLTDLSRVRTVLERNAADRLKLKILRLGGFARTRIALDLADFHGVRCIIGHGFCLSPAASAELCLTLSHGNVYTPIETVGPLKTAATPFGPPLQIDDGRMRVPDSDGLGVELDNERLDDFLESSTRIS
jgi:L-alanine-DL-glutamate epimerase-like enolase superfamily enzyme